MKVVNDLAERRVVLIQEFNSSITHNEEQKQFLLQVVEDHRREFSVPTKIGAVKRTQPQCSLKTIMNNHIYYTIQYNITVSYSITVSLANCVFCV